MICIQYSTVPVQYSSSTARNQNVYGIGDKCSGYKEHRIFPYFLTPQRFGYTNFTCGIAALVDTSSYFDLAPAN